MITARYRGVQNKEGKDTFRMVVSLDGLGILKGTGSGRILRNVHVTRVDGWESSYSVILTSSARYEGTELVAWGDIQPAPISNSEFRRMRHATKRRNHVRGLAKSRILDSHTRRRHNHPSYQPR